MELLELKNRQVVDLSEVPQHWGTSYRHFGVALDNDEAQVYLKEGLRVFCDEGGPYLVVRLRADQHWPYVFHRNSVDVTVEPRRWTFRDESGVICWMKNIV
jgi:hypothetical protein